MARARFLQVATLALGVLPLAAGTAPGPEVAILAGAPEPGDPRLLMAVVQVDGAGAAARFRDLSAVAFAARIPQAAGAELQDRWVVADGNAVRLVSPEGRVDTFARLGPDAWAPGAPAFRELALRPWAGPGDGPWECFLRDQFGRIWRLDAAGRFTLKRDRGPVVAGMAADRAGNLYLLETDGDGPARLLRIAPDGAEATLAGGPAHPGAAGDPEALHAPRDLALGGDGRSLYLVEDACTLRRVSLRDGRITTLPFRAPDGASCRGLASLGRFLLADCGPGLYRVDPADGSSRQVYRDPGADAPMGPVAGSCPAPGTAARRRRGALGRRFFGAFAVDGAGRICAVASMGQLALLLRLPLGDG